jgi:hypothetical protein
MAPYNKSKRNMGNKRRGNGAAPIDLTNFGQSNRRTIRATFTRSLVANQVEAVTIGRKVTGSVGNSLIESWFGNDQAGWPLENVRVKSIAVHFDCRGLGAVAFNARPRVGAFMSGDDLAAIDPVRIQDNIEQFGGVAVSPNQGKIIHVKVGPEFTLGRFGETGANTLVVYSRGFEGIARVQVNYEVLGFPATRVILPVAEDVEKQEAMCRPTEKGTKGTGDVDPQGRKTCQAAAPGSCVNPCVCQAK